MIGAVAFAIAGLVDSFWVLVAMFALAGVGNTVYHPADYALLSHQCRAEPHRPGILDPHFRRHARLGGRARRACC